ncbi:MAG: PD-(D/E)XK nuclease family protein [Planctomycetes bacterium]|nr:PD-(D/E)XK nuclease family protein [Planctomycetota bacterium]
MSELRHEFSWSVSRRGLAETCLRAYYHQYYLAWRGWERDAPAERAESYRLKNTTRLPMWAGDCLHQAIEQWFEQRAAGRTLGAEELVERALARFRGGYKQSRDEAAQWRRAPKRHTRLQEHHYAEACVDEPSGRAREYGGRFVERIQRAARWFCESSELAAVRAAPPEQWLACEQLGTIELFKTAIHAVPDFAYRDAGGVLWIHDWKSGSERPEHAFQLALYALYAEQRWGADPTGVRCVADYLEEGRAVEHRFDAEALEGVLGAVHASITALRELHFDAGGSDGEPARFPQLSVGASACATCAFRGPCGR